MRVRCIHNNASQLDACYLNSGWLQSSIIHLSVGEHYSVYGMQLHGGGLNYLVVDDTEYVGWKPSTLFSVADSVIPCSWVFSGGANMHPNNENAIWGYELLCNSDEHHNGLISSEPSAVATFDLQRQRMDVECRQRHVLGLIESFSSVFDEKATNDMKNLAYWNEIEMALEMLKTGLQKQGHSIPKKALEKCE